MKKIKMLLLLSAMVLLSACNNNSTEKETTSNNITTSEETTLSTTSSQTETSNNDENSILKEMSVLSDQVTLLIPKTFELMSDEMAKVKYPSESRPSVIYTNESGTINVAFSHSNEPMSIDDIPDYTDIIEDTYKNAYPSATWYRAGAETINESEVGILELITPAADTEIYNLLWLSVVDGRMLLTAFNCTIEELDEWQPIAKSILESFRIK